MKRRIAKKLRRAEALARREVLGHPKPCPPVPTGCLLVPDDYVGPILVTTPSGREKVRYVDEKRRVWRDSHFWHGGGFHIRVHAVSCRVEVVRLLVVDEPATHPRPALELVSSHLVGRAPRAPVPDPAQAAHTALLSAGLPEHLVVTR